MPFGFVSESRSDSTGFLNLSRCRLREGHNRIRSTETGRQRSGCIKLDVIHRQVTVADRAVSVWCETNARAVNVLILGDNLWLIASPAELKVSKTTVLGLLRSLEKPTHTFTLLGES